LRGFGVRDISGMKQEKKMEMISMFSHGGNSATSMGIYNQSFIFFIYFAPFLMFLDALESS
jgi:hypothetical protein